MEEIKQRMSDYWTERAPDFSRLRMKELSGGKHELWLAEFDRYLPSKKPLDILDLGTGTGFFCFLLGREGHRMTGIDLTAGMIDEACRTSAELGIPINFQVMDAEKPDFAPHSFDVLVTRNLTWGLPHLAEAYANWHTLLRPGGLLINFDADYCREDTSAPLPENHAHKGISTELAQEYENFKNILRPAQQPRPQWDRELWTAAGFHNIEVDTGVWKRIYADFDEFYNPTPIFTLTATA